jgi:hypothetical protein
MERLDAGVAVRIIEGVALDFLIIARVINEKVRLPILGNCKTAVARAENPVFGRAFENGNRRFLP